MSSPQNVEDLRDNVEKQIDYHRRTLSQKTDPLAVVSGFLAFVGVLAAVPLDFFLAVVTLGFPIISCGLVGIFGLSLYWRLKEIIEDADQKYRLLPKGGNRCFPFIYYSLASERALRLFQPHYTAIAIFMGTFYASSILFVIWIQRLTNIEPQITLTYLFFASLPFILILAIWDESKSIKHFEIDHEVRLIGTPGKDKKSRLIDQISFQLRYNQDVFRKIKSMKPEISIIFSLSFAFILCSILLVGFFLSMVIGYTVAGNSMGINTIFISQFQDVSHDASAQAQLINSLKHYISMLFFLVVYYIVLTYFAFNSAVHKLSYSCYWILNSIKKEIEKSTRKNEEISPDLFKEWYGSYIISTMYDNLAVDFFGIFSIPKTIFSLTNNEIEDNCLSLTEYIRGRKDHLFYYQN